VQQEKQPENSELHHLLSKNNKPVCEPIYTVSVFPASPVWQSKVMGIIYCGFSFPPSGNSAGFICFK